MTSSSSSSSSEMWKSKLGTNYPKDFLQSNEKTFHQQLQDLRHEPANRDCADCGAKGCTIWASVNIGVFLCITCGSHHRSIGTHISKPKGCTGTYWWGPDELENMRKIGNARASQIYGSNSASIPSGLTPANTMEWRKYITDKYDVKNRKDDDAAGPATSSLLSPSSQLRLQESSRAPNPSLGAKGNADLMTFEEGKGSRDWFANVRKSTTSAATRSSSKILNPSTQNNKKDVDLLGLNNKNSAILKGNKRSLDLKDHDFLGDSPRTPLATTNDNFFAEFGL